MNTAPSTLKAAADYLFANERSTTAVTGKGTAVRRRTIPPLLGERAWVRASVPSRSHAPFATIGCWMLDVGCWMFSPDSFSRFRLGRSLAACIFVASQTAFAADTNAVLDSWYAAQKNLHSWSADFTQTRTLKTLTQPLATTGHLDFAMPDQFRWVIGNPPRTIALRQDDKMFVIYPLLKRAEEYPLGRNTPQQWRDMMSLLQAGFPTSRQQFEAEFEVLSLTQTNSAWQLALQPQARLARQMMPELRLGLATNDFSLVSTEMVFADGSRMQSDFTHSVLNPVLDNKLFEWQPPADFTVTEPLRK